ncbi:MAG TPA: chorismate synthase, partial [Pirellulales bacterium]
MLRYLTAGESHGKAIVALIDGFPAGLTVDTGPIDVELKRRQGGYGRGGRQRIETDTVEILSGIWQNVTLGSPIALEVINKDYKLERLEDLERPRPGHADLAGYYKYGHMDLRDVLERASARETTARVAAGAIARALLAELGIEILSHVTHLGGVEISKEELPQTFEQLKARVEENDLRAGGSDKTLDAIRKKIDTARNEGTTLGGEIEIIAVGLPPGLGSYVQWDRKLDGQLAQAVMSVHAVKSVSIGAGDEAHITPGKDFH